MNKLIARAFLSHSHHDESLARRLHDQLALSDVRVFEYSYDQPFGAPLLQDIESRIEESDFLIVILSEAARCSGWVSREIGLALHIQESCGGTHPIIIGVRPIESAFVPLTYEVLDYRSGAPCGREPYQFGKGRLFEVAGLGTEEQIRDLVNCMTPRVDYIEGGSADDDRLLRESLAVYEACFPDEAERDASPDIEDWLEIARKAEVNGSPWREVYAVLSVAGCAIGMAFFTAHVRRRWSFANYFAVVRGWRELARSERFLQQVGMRLRSIVKNMRGVLFEVEPIDFKALGEFSATTDFESLADGQRETLATNLRSLRRLQWYETYGARALVGSTGAPLTYWQPSMEETRSPANERLLIPMVKTFEPETLKQADLTEILNFLYDDLYGDAYGDGPMKIPEYRAYSDSVKRRVLAELTPESGASCVAIPRMARGVLKNAKASGFSRHLHL